MKASLALLTAAVLLAGTASAQITANQTEETDVTVTVSDTIAVDIQPANLDYDNAIVGTRNESSDRGFGAVEIENTGSTYINRVWLNATTPSQDPYGSGSASNYDAANFLDVKPQGVFSGDSTDWHPVNKKVYMYSDQDESGNGNTRSPPSFIQPPTGWAPYEVGEIRRGNESIFFIVNTNSNSCDGSSTQPVRVGNVSATDTRLGTVDFTSSTEYGWSNYTLAQVQGNAPYGVTQQSDKVFSGTSGVALNWSYTSSDSPTEVDLLTKCDDTNEQPHAYVNKYNINTEGADDIVNNNGQATTYLIQETGGNTDNMLAPGNYSTIDVAMNVPQGVAAGSITSGTLRVKITADESADTS